MKNKKVLIIAVVAVVVVLAVVLGVVLGGNKTPDPNPTPATEKEYKFGLGVEFAEFTAGEIGATVAAVVLDDAGKIVACRIDTIQNQFSVDEEVNYSRINTKRELKYDYKMSAFGTSLIGNATVKEWFEQAEAYEAWVVVKTATQIKNMKTQVAGEYGYVIANEKDLLDAGCTISIEEFRDAVVKACNDAQGTTFKTNGTFTVGLAINSEDNGSTVSDEGYTVKMNCDIAATVMAGGKVLASLNDAMQPQVTVDADGAVTEQSVGKGAGVLKTKRELKEDYKMAAFGTSLVGNAKATEWYIQSAAFSAHIKGMTKAQVSAMPTQTISNGYTISNDKALLDAGCTMSIDGIISVVVKSIDNAR